MSSSRVNGTQRPDSPLTFLLVIGAAIALLLIMTVARFYARGNREGILFLVLAGALAFVFFRKHKIALAISSLSWVLVNAGMTAHFRPSFRGYALTIRSAPTSSG